MAKNAGISKPLLYGFAISTIGGPLAFVALYLIGASGPALNSLGLATVIGILLFFFPILIWYNYSRKIASSGGLYEFVRQSCGEKVAKIQGLMWSLSYLLYLPYTVTYILFFILPAIVSVPQSYLYALEVILPVLFCGAMLLGRKVGLSFMLIVAISQIAIIFVLLGLAISNSGISFISLVPNVNGLQLLQGGAAISLLFVCASLTLFLGGEVKDAKKVIGKTLIISFSVVAILVLLSAILFSPAILPAVEAYVLPGFMLAKSYSGITLAKIVGIFVLASLAALVLAEFFALSRLFHSMLKIEVEKSIYVISAFFILSDLISLINPYKFYDYLLLPSLVALYVSQLIPFAAYPLFLKKFFSRVTPLDIVVTVVAILLALYGLATPLISGT